MQKGFIGSLIFATIVAIFALRNGDKVLIDFIFTKVEVSQAIIIFVSSILGAVTVSTLGVVRNMKFKKEIKELNKRIDRIENEKDDLQLLIEQKEGQETDIDNKIEDEYIFNNMDPKNN